MGRLAGKAAGEPGAAAVQASPCPSIVRRQYVDLFVCVLFAFQEPVPTGLLRSMDPAQAPDADRGRQNRRVLRFGRPLVLTFFSYGTPEVPDPGFVPLHPERLPSPPCRDARWPTRTSAQGVGAESARTPASGADLSPSSRALARPSTPWRTVSAQRHAGDRRRPGPRRPGFSPQERADAAEAAWGASVHRAVAGSHPKERGERSHPRSPLCDPD